MAKQPRVWDGSQWQELAVTLPDLSNYSTTTQMNTAISNASVETVLLSGSFTGASAVNLSNALSNTYKYYRVYMYANSSSGPSVDLLVRFRENTTDKTTGYYNGGLSARYTGTVASFGAINNGAYMPVSIISSGEFAVINFDIYRHDATIGAISANGFSRTEAYYIAAGGSNMTMTNFTGLTFYGASGTISGNYILTGIK